MVWATTRSIVVLLVVLGAHVQAASSSSSSVNSSMAPVTTPVTSSNGVSACVQYGDCTKGGSYATTETQNSPVTSPASHSVADITDSAASRSYVNSLAAAGASQAYASSPYSGSVTSVPAPTTVSTETVETSDGQKYTTSIIASDSSNHAAMLRPLPTSFIVVALITVMGLFL
ncbi:hypothetical protein MPSI1_002435 [Malassezia psittaci]|uniref:Uncharacterized protein n=1 Tax=Malassezia psittaci TaxID=1821823 RepID=A0AAF0JL10_9BASI|nr:hypothetical protein MPSI1_002435 [Malassezia psittaci]